MTECIAVVTSCSCIKHFVNLIYTACFIDLDFAIKNVNANENENLYSAFIVQKPLLRSMRHETLT